MSQNFDLWGDPVPEPTERRGRPKHVATQEKRIRVSVLVALNKPQSEIASAMGISEPTLRREYSSELKYGLAQKRAEVMTRLWAAVEKGNVSAMKAFIQETEKSDLQGRPAARKTPQLGKKAAAELAAQTVGEDNEWAGLLH